MEKYNHLASFSNSGRQNFLQNAGQRLDSCQDNGRSDDALGSSKDDSKSQILASGANAKYRLIKAFKPDQKEYEGSHDDVLNDSSDDSTIVNEDGSASIPAINYLVSTPACIKRGPKLHGNNSNDATLKKMDGYCGQNDHQRSSRNDGGQILKSYVMASIGKFIGNKESIRLQQLNRYFYDTGACRLVDTIPSPCTTTLYNGCRYSGGIREIDGVKVPDKEGELVLPENMKPHCVERITGHFSTRPIDGFKFEHFRRIVISDATIKNRDGKIVALKNEDVIITDLFPQSFGKSKLHYQIGSVGKAEK